ncbi:uncharacterized protein SCODWIG_02246 [Saccharomycodes ludwigii]|uniref:Mediator of RNA polymerase II transcription subunit 21 n=1 Tax=Saccharomycodes ludwigii TaxID=36035 RepID=A0A376B711_9ASCO|nr:hypothetical protein SCDLUD_004640 [Saccharomycodes ludwigii]KAH3899209.1 hypothetical protein SCDLUD_004640 [Saccharomycodes ludwigii]SSD60485.1 uncharacterized protein SCODWIG_02246 [Saccharomycodes ludwigii]
MSDILLSKNEFNNKNGLNNNNNNNNTDNKLNEETESSSLKKENGNETPIINYTTDKDGDINLDVVEEHHTPKLEDLPKKGENKPTDENSNSVTDNTSKHGNNQEQQQQEITGSIKTKGNKINEGPRTDRLTQLQICFDQMVEQFVATLNYVDKNHDFVPLNDSEIKMTDPFRPQQDTNTISSTNNNNNNNVNRNNLQQLPPLPSKQEFENSIDELSTDLILKTRQILQIIDALPGIDVSSEEQLTKIEKLSEELVNLETEKLKWISTKDELLGFINQLINGFTNDMNSSS